MSQIIKDQKFFCFSHKAGKSLRDLLCHLCLNISYISSALSLNLEIFLMLKLERIRSSFIQFKFNLIRFHISRRKRLTIIIQKLKCNFHFICKTSGSYAMKRSNHLWFPGKIGEKEISQVKGGVGFYIMMKTWKPISQFLSHENYKAFGKDHGEVSKLRARVTLHQERKSAEDGLIKYCLACLVGPDGRTSWMTSPPLTSPLCVSPRF